MFCLIVLSRQVRELESEMNDIGQWLVSAGQTLLAETSIGTTTDQAEALLREHEAIELKCRVRARSLPLDSLRKDLLMSSSPLLHPMARW